MNHGIRLIRAGARSFALMAVLLGALSPLLVAGAAPASAHDVLIRTSPADGSTVALLPDVIVLTFDEPGQTGGTVVAVTGPAGNVATGAAMLVDSDVRQAVGPGSPAGRYTVHWRVVSADGHPVAGSFSFTATKGSGGTATAAPSDAPTRQVSAPGHGATGWAIGAAIVVFAMGIGAILLYRRRAATGGGGHGDED